ncbi:MAG: hypothetical protein K9W45_10250 [Candidatus Heimdallarchaeum aukensis]|uniref:Uncharacterized protein n=1 Tax=Candidatus Heimdallarchaeum aukensis TaxID=2876573 RepID=A0A9Y1BJK5_9ARCH|nr:MAG: hypothetical protein K9W45_10250 [Candidatus Heimdallarchaeum aukensis]
MESKYIGMNLLKSLSNLDKGMRKKNIGMYFLYFSSLNRNYLYKTFNCFELSSNKFSNDIAYLVANNSWNISSIERRIFYE